MNDSLVVENLVKRFPVRPGFFWRAREFVQAVTEVSFRLGAGETLGLVGESGCGKTTLARMLARLIEPDQGSIRIHGEDLVLAHGKRLKSLRQKVQMIFQDPYASLNPRMSVGEIIAEPLVIHKRVSRREKRGKVAELLKDVGLSADYYDRYPHEFSGGQRQRVGIARSLSLLPSVIIADEPVSALDISVAAQILDLLKALQKEHGTSYLFIAHDLRMVEYMSDRVAVMYLGRLLEVMSRGNFSKPLHPYTQALREAVPVLDPQKKVKKIFLSGEVPSPVSPPSGCAFHPRCPFAEERCRNERPFLQEWRPSHWAACHLVDKISGGA